METLNIAEKKDNIKWDKDNIKWDYDAEVDVLYILYGNHDNAEGVDTGEGTIIRMQPDF